MLDGIPATSLWGLKARAEEHLKPRGLFRDAQALAWYEKLRPFYTPAINDAYHPILQKSIAIRTDILDDVVRRHIAARDKPAFIELGCGFSTRYMRLDLASECDWYELDLPEMIETRGSLGVSGEKHWHIAASAFDPQWIEYLPGTLDPQNILMVAEGLFMYFPRPQVTFLLKHLKEKLPGATLAFDVMGSANLSMAQGPAEAVDAPMYWGVEHLQAFCLELGLTPLDDLSYAAQMKRRPFYKTYIPYLARWLLRIPQITRRMGGTLLVKL